MADDDKELFESAMNDAAPEPEAPQPEEGTETPDSPPRDERGRFAPKAQDAQPEPEPEPQPQPEQPVQQQPEHRETQGIPPWRLKEEADARRAAEERARQHEQEMADLRRQLAQMQQQTKQPEQVPDIYENPSAFVDHGVRTAVDPIKQEIGQIREFYSQRDAVREFGADKVKAAYDAMDQALRSRDPEAHAVYQRAKDSLDPYGEIVRWHQKTTVFSQIGSDPNAWFEKQLEERLKDPTHQAKLMERIRGNVQPTAQRPVTQLPPSLNRATSAASPEEDGDDNSDAGLLKSALRR